MDTTTEIIGLYPIEAKEPVHLVEIRIKNSQGLFDIYKFTQEVHGQPKTNWQVPYNEKILDEKGNNVIADGFSVTNISSLCTGNVRIIFFFHYLDISKPLTTPFGETPLPRETRIPPRLQTIKDLLHKSI